MIELEQYYSLHSGRLRFTREQGSEFAKRIAGDFNPIHNVDAGRFCVPGDLLFAVFLHRYGICESMQFEFAGMVGDKTELHLPALDGHQFSLTDHQGKSFLEARLGGDRLAGGSFVRELTLRYAQFSGQTFPHILIDLMQQHQVMINPDRPLVIYKNMGIELTALQGRNIVLQLESARMQVVGKKGDVHLQFSINADGRHIGNGEKNMVLSGLRKYDQVRIDEIVGTYAEWKSAYCNNH